MFISLYVSIHSIKINKDLKHIFATKVIGIVSNSYTCSNTTFYRISRSIERSLFEEFKNANYWRRENRKKIVKNLNTSSEHLVTHQFKSQPLKRLKMMILYFKSRENFSAYFFKFITMDCEIVNNSQIYKTHSGNASKLVTYKRRKTVGQFFCNLIGIRMCKHEHAVDKFVGIITGHGMRTSYPRFFVCNNCRTIPYILLSLEIKITIIILLKGILSVACRR